VCDEQLDLTALSSRECLVYEIWSFSTLSEVPLKFLMLVRNAASSLNLLDNKGCLVALDSLGTIELINLLEKEAKVEIPPGSLRQENFKTLETVAAMMEDLE
jgi:acyl carrier protein